MQQKKVALWCAGNDVAIELLKRTVPAGLFQFLYSEEVPPKERNLLQQRDNLSLAMDHSNEINQSTKMQLLQKSKRLQRQIMNAQSVRVIEKQLTNVLQHWKQRVGNISTPTAGNGKVEEKVVVLRRRRQRLKSTENWDLFYYKFNLDHALPNLIWNFKCREELREAIENETRAFNNDKDLGQGYVIAWNFVEFEVPYNCLNDEIKIGEYYLRLLLESGSDILENVTKGLSKSSGQGGTAESLTESKISDSKDSNASTEPLNGDALSGGDNESKLDDVPDPEKMDESSDNVEELEVNSDKLQIINATSFFNDLYHRFLLSTNMKSMCLQAMTIVYTKCHEEIGPFNDTRYIILMLEKTTDRLERDRLLMFMDSLILNRANVKEIVDANGVRVLVDLLTLAHLHTSRAYVPTQTNVIESGNMQNETEKEWYYGQKQGPFSFKEIKDLYAEGTITEKTKLWAQG